MTLDDLHKIYSDHKEGNWIISKQDAQYLFQLVKTLNSKRILDLGTGIGASSAVMAFASSDKTTIDTVEQYKKCIDIAQKITLAELKEKITYHHSPTVVKQIDDLKYENFSCYTKLPQGNWDFIVVDGPGPWLEDGYFIDIPNGDFWEFTKDIKKGCILYIDGRKVMVSYFAKFLSHYYNVLKDDADCLILVRNDKPFDITKINENRLAKIIKKQGKLPEDYK